MCANNRPRNAEALLNLLFVHWHQVPTLIGCLIFKERLLLTTYCFFAAYSVPPNCFATPTYRPFRAAVTAKKREYEELFSTCQTGFCASRMPLPTPRIAPPDKPRLHTEPLSKIVSQPYRRIAQNR